MKTPNRFIFVICPDCLTEDQVFIIGDFKGQRHICSNCNKAHSIFQLSMMKPWPRVPNGFFRHATEEEDFALRELMKAEAHKRVAEIHERNAREALK